ncbi:MFS transporter [Niallia sp. Krafla_26]|uniref:MFS transporter n=1 Tax=Niallia sp. Krafla_26 TaxID=3064703 RepID=UPI003D1634BD
MDKESVTLFETKTKRSFHYGYVIVALSFLVMVAAMGIRGSFGTYVTEWEQTFSVNRFWVSLVSFINLTVYGISIIFAGRLSDIIGPRKVLTVGMALLSLCLAGSYFSTNIGHMIILYGLIGSVGFGFVSNVTVSVGIVRWFKEKKGLMISIVVVGMAAGPMIYGPLNLFLIEEIGWKWMFVLYGAVYGLILLPLIFFLYRDNRAQAIPVENVNVVDKQKLQLSTLLKSIFLIFRYRVTWLITITYVVCGFTDVGLIYTHMIPLGEHKGFSAVILGNVMLWYGVSNIIGTVMIGFLTDKFSNQKILSVLFMIRVVALILLLFIEQPLWLITFALLYGFTDIATIAPFTMLCSHIFGEKHMGSAFGVISFTHQFGAAIGSLVPGMLFSLSGNYESSLWISSILLIISAILLLYIKDKNQLSV